MSRILVLSVIVASLSTIVGCGASATQKPAMPASTNVADARDEAVRAILERALALDARVQSLIPKRETLEDIFVRKAL